MEETMQEEEVRENPEKQWNEAANFEAIDERSAFSPLQPTPGFFQQQNHALCSQLPSVGLQNSNALSQMSIFPSRFYYPCYTPTPYPRPMFDPCTSYPALYQSEEFLPKEKRRRCRTVFTQEQLHLLEQGFSQQKYPDSKFRHEMAVKTGLAEDRVQVWFQNRRAKEKRLLEEKLFFETQTENVTRVENQLCDAASAVDESGQMLSTSHQSLQEDHVRKLDNLITTEVEDSGSANSVEGEITAQSLTEGNTSLLDINIAAYLTSGPLPSPSVSRVESDGTTRNPEVEPNEKRVLISLETPISAASLESLPRQLFVNTVSSFCQNNIDDERTVYQGNSTGLMNVIFSEAIHAKGEETVISEDVEYVESTSKTGISSAENNPTEMKYVNLCV